MSEEHPEWPEPYQPQLMWRLLTQYGDHLEPSGTMSPNASDGLHD
ncbi:uncharacterized protein FTOL_13887 [Fusarium torulosum]|uniref:Uncharacterized protein n=1 Tax=Fusarium torulosum TaxID=33205 RepID=A0AAE8MP13_9HYPO|nr:uncharacterized protein FTOL_13887 [Fusarium torulosum]